MMQPDANIRCENPTRAMIIKELIPPQFESIRPLLGKYSKHPVVNAVIDKNSPGRVFVDRFPRPSSALVTTRVGFTYLLGLSTNIVFIDGLKKLLDVEIFPAICSSEDPSLIFYPLGHDWEASLKNIIDGR